MERRVLTRQPIVREVVLSCDHFGLVRGVTRDISLSGVYVETGNALMPGDADVNICFVFKDKEQSTIHSIKAHVKRVDDDGAGLQFSQALEESFLYM